MPALAVVSKGLEVTSFGAFCFAWLRHRVFLLFEECCEGMGDRDTSGGKAPSRNGIINLLVDLFG
jgi:hypothetical protein